MNKRRRSSIYFQFWPYWLLAVWYQLSHLTSLSLSFLVCTMKITYAPASECVVQMKGGCVCRGLVQSLVQSYLTSNGQSQYSNLGLPYPKPKFFPEFYWKHPVHRTAVVLVRTHTTTCVHALRNPNKSESVCISIIFLKPILV